MAITLPLPVRIAAGVLATGLDGLRHLPANLPTLPVTVAGQAVRASLRVQQEIAELAGRGDELLAGITSRPTEHPAWARFDDEDGDAAPADRTDGDAAPDDRTDGDAAPADTVAGTDVPPDQPDPGPDDPADMPGYDDLRLAQVRARLRGLDATAVARLLEHEQRGASRAGYLTLLTNRLTTLRSDTPQEPTR